MGYAKSKFAAVKALKEELRPFYNSRPTALKDAIKSNAEDFRKWYCTDGIDSEYFSVCDRINKVFSENILAFQKLGIPVTAASDISVTPDISSSLAYELERRIENDVVRSDGYYSLDKYIEMYANIDYDDFGRYERGLFGIEVVIHGYYYNCGNAVDEMRNDMQKQLNSNVERINETMKGVWKEFCDRLASKVSEQKSALKKQVDAYKATISCTPSASVQSATDYLDALKKEIPQCMI